MISRSTKSVITKPQNVYVMRDIMCSGYVAGGNTRFFGESAQPGRRFSSPVEAGDVMDAIDKRLSFQNDAEGEYESMLAFGCGYGDGAKRDQVISITDRLLPWEVTRQAQPVKEYFPGEQANYNAYKNAWRLNTIHFGEDVRAAENMEFISQGELLHACTEHCHGVATESPLCCAHRLDEQRPLLHRPAPQVQPVQQPVP